MPAFKTPDGKEIEVNHEPEKVLESVTRHEVDSAVKHEMTAIEGKQLSNIAGTVIAGSEVAGGIVSAPLVGAATVATMGAKLGSEAVKHQKEIEEGAKKLANTMEHALSSIENLFHHP